MRECPVFFAASGEVLFGILTEPCSSPVSDLVVIVLAEAVPGGIRDGNAVLVRLARAIAASGYATFRFDYHGVGESTGPPPCMRRNDPFLGDLDGALNWLRGHGYRHFAVVGSCFGAQTGLLAVPDRADIRGVALLSCLVAAQDDTLEPPSELLLSAIGTAGKRGVAILFCYGRDDAVFAEFEAARPHGLDACLSADDVHVEIIEGEIHSFPDVDLQPHVIDTVVRWLGATAEQWYPTHNDGRRA